MQFPSRSHWKQESEKILHENIKKLGGSYDVIHAENLDIFLNTIQKNKIQKKLIILFHNSLTYFQNRNLEKIALMNELIWIHAFHPFEKNPDSNTLFQ